MNRKKPSLYLISGKTLRKSYDVVKIYMMDESVFEFSLDEWDMFESYHGSYEWVEFKRKDKNNRAMECFPVNNLLRVSFVTKGKEVVNEKPILKPVA